MDRVNPGGIGSGAIKCRVAKGDDPSETKHEIERQGEQNRNQNLAREGKPIAESEVPAETGDPWDHLDPPRPVLAQRGDGRGDHAIMPARTIRRAAIATTRSSRCRRKRRRTPAPDTCTRCRRSPAITRR